MIKTDQKEFMWHGELESIKRCRIDDMMDESREEKSAQREETSPWIHRAETFPHPPKTLRLFTENNSHTETTTQRGNTFLIDMLIRFCCLIEFVVFWF